MTRPFRLLDATTTTATDTPSSSPHLDSDLLVILAALLCALICVLGLIVVARCAWIRRLSAPSSSLISSPPPTQSPYSAKATNKGVKKKTLLSLPKLTFSSYQKFSDCTICLATFVDGDELRVLPQCGHAFHVPCIDTWLGSHSSCPSCRRILVISTLPVPDKTDDNLQCERFRNVQANSSSSSNTGSDGVDDDGAKRIDDADADSVSNNRFLP